MTEDISTPQAHQLLSNFALMTPPVRPEEKKHNSKENMNSAQAKSSHGRWTREEHDRFVEGLRKFGKNWRKVEEFIGTRTGAQIRSHAQKYFNRLNKKREEIGLSAGESMPKMRDYDNDIDEEDERDEDVQLAAESKNCSDSDIVHSSSQNQLNHQYYALQQQQQLQMQQQQQQQQQQSSDKIASNISIMNQLSHSQSQLSQSAIQTNNSNSQPSKKRDWSKILSEQEKLKQMGEKREKKSVESKQEIKEPESRIKEEFVPLKKPQSIDFLQLQQDHLQLSPTDFINQSLLSTIFEPADIQTHLMQFYMAQVSLEQWIKQQQQQQVSYENEIKKKIKLNEKANTASNSHPNNHPNIRRFNEEPKSLNSSHSTSLSHSTNSQINNYCSNPTYNMEEQVNHLFNSAISMHKKQEQEMNQISQGSSLQQQRQILANPMNQLADLMQLAILSQQQQEYQQQQQQQPLQSFNYKKADLIKNNSFGCNPHSSDNNTINGGEYEILCQALLTAITSQFDRNGGINC